MKEKKALFFRFKTVRKHMKTQGRYSWHILKPVCTDFTFSTLYFQALVLTYLFTVLLVAVLKYFIIIQREGMFT